MMGSNSTGDATRCSIAVFCAVKFTSAVDTFLNIIACILSVTITLTFNTPYRDVDVLGTFIRSFSTQI